MLMVVDKPAPKRTAAPKKVIKDDSDSEVEVVEKPPPRRKAAPATPMIVDSDSGDELELPPNAKGKAKATRKNTYVFCALGFTECWADKIHVGTTRSAILKKRSYQ
jgi:hypothetical protein